MCGCTGGQRGREAEEGCAISALVIANCQMGFAVWSGFSLELPFPSPRKRFPFCVSRCKLKQDFRAFPLRVNPAQPGWPEGNPHGAGFGRFACPAVNPPISVIFDGHALYSTARGITGSAERALSFPLL